MQTHCLFRFPFSRNCPAHKKRVRSAENGSYVLVIPAYFGLILNFKFHFSDSQKNLVKKPGKFYARSKDMSEGATLTSTF